MSFSSYHYSPLRPQSWKIPPHILVGLLAICMTLSFLAGRVFSPPTSIPTTRYNTISLKPTKVTFAYNRTFSSPPSNLTNRAWAELFPPQGTFFTHPRLAPQRSTLAVYHQLHCLDGIRRNFYHLYAAARRADAEQRADAEERKEAEMMEEKAMAHVRHCIDLLRQSVMCLADTTVEIKDDARGGVRGFGVEHQCGDWEQLGRMVGKWQQ